MDMRDERSVGMAWPPPGTRSMASTCWPTTPESACGRSIPVHGHTVGQVGSLKAGGRVPRAPQLPRASPSSSGGWDQVQPISARRGVVVKPRLYGGRGQWTTDEVSLADLASQSRHGV